ncbi:hypothetical protein EVAR_53287_1 [Eumeta japonica]|uniref:Uncharacterized protein n=1 Tax=Eumeta variegata TaxID=151549 RepID=A0A4C1YVW4_EUMVA|nr:hypothetical protein EVAR_53287_1 [Eumeta japonica]
MQTYAEIPLCVQVLMLTVRFVGPRIRARPRSGPPHTQSRRPVRSNGSRHGFELGLEPEICDYRNSREALPMLLLLTNYTKIAPSSRTLRGRRDRGRVTSGLAGLRLRLDGCACIAVRVRVCVALVHLYTM